MTITPVAPEITRDRYGRPLVVPPGGGKPVPYTRCTTFVSAIDDTYNLNRWEKRMVALGLAKRPDLVMAVAAHGDDKNRLNQICDDAKEAAGSSAAATTGTALHALTERIDRGYELGTVPEAYLPDLAAYTEATKDLKAVHIEAFTVLDSLRIGGTPDRVVAYKGQRYIADLKTGDIEWGIGKIAAQLAVYARSYLYDLATGERTQHGADLTKGLIIHAPAGQGRCELVWVDIVAGWHAVQVARQVREKRSLKFADLVTPFGPDLGEQLAASLSLEQQITACDTADAVRALWAAHENEWTDALTEAAKRHIANLPAEQVAS